MITLQTYYLSRKETLAGELEKAKSLESYFRIVDTFFSTITDLDGDYVRSLTPSQARVALSLLAIFSNMFRSIVSYFPYPAAFDVEHNLEFQTERTSPGFRILSLDTLTGIGTAGVIGGILANPLLAIPLAILAGFAASTATHSLAPHEREQTYRRLTPMPQSAGPNMDAVKHAVSPDFLEELFKMVDKVTEDYGRLEEASRPKKVEPRIEDHRSILVFFQDLIGWYARKQSDLQDKTFAPLRMRLENTLPDLLSRYGITIRHYDPAASQMDATAFDFEKDVGTQKLQAPQMVQPALERGGAVVVKGRVILPNG